jgi:hypothetical protein
MKTFCFCFQVCLEGLSLPPSLSFPLSLSLSLSLSFSLFIPFSLSFSLSLFLSLYVRFSFSSFSLSGPSPRHVVIFLTVEKGQKKFFIPWSTCFFKTIVHNDWKRVKKSHLPSSHFQWRRKRHLSLWRVLLKCKVILSFHLKIVCWYIQPPRESSRRK